MACEAEGVRLKEIGEDDEEFEQPIEPKANATAKSAARKEQTRDMAPPNGMFPGMEVCHMVPKMKRR